ncbi:MAG: hypothetical protein SGILL_009101 [Bacillariaceae sp.]
MTDPSSEEPVAQQPSAAALANRDVNHHTSDKADVGDKQKTYKPGQDTAATAATTAVMQDTQLPDKVQKDPRGDGPISARMTKKATSRGNGRNTESFDPKSTLVRPDVRVLVGNPSSETLGKQLKHDDVVVVPELFGAEDDWSLYYKLVEELTELQSKETKGSEFISWHEGSHLICKEPKESPTFQMILKRLCDYFDIDAKSAGTRFNWYKDSQDWKPFHHDSAAFNPRRAKNQNITVGVSFGAMRELAFIRAVPEHLQQDPNYQHYQRQHPPCRMYFPQTNNGVFTFGRDVNIHWKHGVNALPESEQSNKGRISIILWGLARNVVEQPNSPPLLGADGQGPHANRDRHNNRRRGGGGHNHHNRHNKRRRHDDDHRSGSRQDHDEYPRDRDGDRRRSGGGHHHHHHDRRRDEDNSYRGGRDRREERRDNADRRGYDDRRHSHDRHGKENDQHRR